MKLLPVAKWERITVCMPISSQNRPDTRFSLKSRTCGRRMQMHCLTGACVRKIWDIRVQGGMAKPVRRMLHSFHGEYERYLEKSGRQMAQIKPLRMIVTEEGKELFRKAAEVAENEAE